MQGLINGKPVEFTEDETILSVARRHGVFIPTLCELADAEHTPGTCRVCLVEIRREGHDPDVVTSCNTPMEPGMEVLTRTQIVREKQRLQVELLLGDHDQDCATCVRHGKCELQDAAQFVGLQRSRYGRRVYFRGRTRDESSVSVVRDMTRCIRCHRCVHVCRDVQGTDVLVLHEKGLDAEIGVRDSLALGTSDCISCGQCTLVCPTGALAEVDDTEQVIDFFYDPDVFTVVQMAPATRIALGEEFYMEPGSNVEGKMITALKQLGADVVLDTNFTADLVIMEEGTELLGRLENGGKLPMITSCSPGWVNYCEKNYPEHLDHVSTTKSPQQCFGALAKTYLAGKMGVDPAKVRVVSIMPCTAKKEEAQRPEMTRDGVPDVDVVLTTRECARLLKREGVWLPDLEASGFDNDWMGSYSGAAEIFGTTGGVMEAAIRTVHYVVTGQELEGVVYAPVRGYEQLREAVVDLGEKGTIKVCVAHGLKAAKHVMERIAAGEADWTFVEIMGCPGGCMGGGGQPRIKKSYQSFWHERQQAIYRIDERCEVRQSHNNPLITMIYDEFLGEPNGHRSHELLHTTYRDRKQVVHHTMKEIWDELKA
ncbi:2Fe-2S iron-sulfur cluster binding domain-containing protein [bacterium]|nr:2Fe-2S iron-sulfur cluster binding domain-containing protein [bacterium]